MSNRGFYHNPAPNVSGLTKKVEGSVTQVTGRVKMAARRSKWRVVTALVVIALMAIPVVGSVARHPVEEPGPVAAATIPFELYTHCGINELKAFGKYFQRVGGALSDGFGNPPKGWGNPIQAGRLSVSGHIATFSDNQGHLEHFEVRPNATGFSMICS